MTATTDGTGAPGAEPDEGAAAGTAAPPGTREAVRRRRSPRGPGAGPEADYGPARASAPDRLRGDA
ncbi:hypothetical protein ACFWF6_31440, partial [Streptomyces goshikiensis]